MDISFIAVADKVNKGDFRTDISQITLVAINKNPWRFDLGWLTSLIWARPGPLKIKTNMAIASQLPKISQISALIFTDRPFVSLCPGQASDRSGRSPAAWS